MKSQSSTFGSALLSSWALLLGFGVLMLGDGLQGTLLAVRADIEGFSATLTGLVMSAFYVGFLVGSILSPRITAKVGHIRGPGCTGFGFDTGTCTLYQCDSMDFLTITQWFLFCRAIYRSRELAE